MKNFCNILIQWYEVNKRDLPWRRTRDPYKIWVSEIILQQTRVNQGLDYYRRFIEKYPDIQSLASSNQDEVLLSWQGLGYYSRARNLHTAARQIMKDHGGVFPEDYSDIIKLQGIGEYTASAIASFSFRQAFPVIDGNVLRFMSRIKGITESITKAEVKKTIKDFLTDQINETDPDVFNQAIMEFGALQCVPGNPDCQGCPFVSSCLACKKGLVNSIPNKKYKAKSIERYFNYILLISEDSENRLLIRQRKDEDIWKGLHEFVLIERDHLMKKENMDAEMKKLDLVILDGFISDDIIHKLSHRKIYARIFVYKVEHLKPVKAYFPTKFKKLQSYAFPRLLSRFLSEYDHRLKIMLEMME